MKKSQKTNILVGIAVLSVPAALYALVNDTALHISQYGYIGGAPTFGTCIGGNLSVGSNNYIGALYSAAVGYAIYQDNTYGLAVGQFNTTNSGTYFVVGNGSGSGRKNAFAVYPSGNVTVPITTTGAKLTVGNPSITSSSTVTTKIHGQADIDSVPAKGGISMGAFTAQ